jgi:uncharacterized RDD family membrane protein YckC
MAKVLDLIVVAVAMNVLPQAGLPAGAAYLLISDGLFDGRSLGKKVLKLKVISVAAGTQVSFRGSMIRNAPLAAGILLLGIPFLGWVCLALILVLEFLLALGNADGMRLGDELAGTMAIEA